MTRIWTVALACLCFGCSWTWTQLSGGGGARCTRSTPTAEGIASECAKADLRLRVSVADETERQELTLHIDRSGERLVAVGINAFGAKQFEVVRIAGKTRTRIFFGGLILHPEELVAFAERHYLASCDPGPAELREPVRVALCGYDATFRSLASSL